jgi:Xaa-Pro dipeptidase
MTTQGASLVFPVDEYKHRVANVQKAMAAADLELLLVFWPENLCYLTGYHTLGYHTFQALLVPSSGEPIFFVRRINKSTVDALAWISRCHVFQDTENPIDVTARLITEGGWSKARVGIEIDAWFLTTKNYQTLCSKLPNMKAIDGSQIVNRVRLFKSAREIEYIRQAARMAEASMKAAEDTIRPGVRENEVAAEVHRALFRAGSEYLGHPPLLASGPRSALNMVAWSDRVIGQNEPIQIEPGGCIHRYHAVFIRTLFTGTPDAEFQRLCDLSAEGMQNAIDFMRPGVTSGEVHDRVKDPARKAGFSHLAVSRAGYSIGIGFPPDWGEGRTFSLWDGDRTPLEANMTIHVTPVLWHERCQVGLSETVLITEKGCEPITSYRRELLLCH